MICAWEYFPNRKGLVTALALSGLGIGPFIFGYISLAIVNPENDIPQLEVEGGMIFDPSTKQTDRVPIMMRIDATLWTCLALIYVIFVSRPDQSTHSDNEDD